MPPSTITPGRLRIRWRRSTRSRRSWPRSERTGNHALDLDPTKVRPSNEALLRRLLKGEALFPVNTLVDALNLCSLRAQLPFGLYDLDRVEPPVVLRRGAPGESYEGIRKGAVHVEGR